MSGRRGRPSLSLAGGDSFELPIPPGDALANASAYQLQLATSQEQTQYELLVR